MKYDIDKSFSSLQKLKLGFNPFIIRLAKPILSISPNGMKSTKTLTIEKISIPMRDGKKIRAYIIKPKHNCKGIIFNFHGGAFVYKAIKYQFTMAKAYAEKTGCAVIVCDYRLSFCSAFNTPFFDCADTYKYIIQNASTWGLNTSIIGVMGDSAGGYLSIQVCSFAFDGRLPMPNFQLLIYPVVDPDMRSQSMKEYTDTPMWNSINNAKMWRTYLKGNTITSPLDCDLSFMPITYIETAQFDCLRDEAILLHEKLQAQNVKSVISNTLHTIHGFDFIKCPITTHAVAKRIRFLLSTIDNLQRQS